MLKPRVHHEALSLLADAAERLDPDLEGRRRALLTLLRELGEIRLTAGLPVIYQEEPGCPVVYIGFSNELGVRVFPAEDQQLVVAPIQAPEERRPVRLRYDRLTGELEGEELDTFLVPVPGEPRRRRSGLAVVVEQAIELIEELTARSREASP